MGKRGRRLSEVDFDLSTIRKLKRLTARVHRGLVEIERVMLRARKARCADGPAQAGTPEDARALGEFLR